MTNVIIKQRLLELINGIPSLTGHLVESNPNQHRTTDVIALSPLLAALTLLKPGDLLGLSVKLLNLPTNATLLVGRMGRILSQVVGDDVFRALGRKHKPEQFHPMRFGKILDVNQLSPLFVSFAPT